MRGENCRPLPWPGPSQMPLAVSLDEAKAHLRVDHGDDDALIDIYLRASIAGLDGPGGALNRGLITQSYVCDLPCFPCGVIDLPMGGVSEVTTVGYIDSDGAAQTVPDSVWQLVTNNRFTAYLALKSGQYWPTAIDQAGAVTIEFKSGFGNAPASIPFNIKAAILLMTGELYQNTAQTSDRQAYENPTYAALLDQYRKIAV